MKAISWNVNGLRAVIGKGFLDFVAANDDADFICLQETKLQEGQLQWELPERKDGKPWLTFWNYAERKGYSGTAILTPHEPLSVRYGLDEDIHNHEGRLITLEYPGFFLVCAYVPNARQELTRIDYRLEWERDVRNYLVKLDAVKPVLYTGDLNVAHEEIDLKNPKSNRGCAGFSDEERSAFGQLLDAGFSDTFRTLYPETAGAYSWWSYRFHARENNAGWRIDYFVVSDRLMPRVTDAGIRADVMGSDHCPVWVTWEE